MAHATAMSRVRLWLLWIHRIAGLGLAGILICAGLTGSIAAFHDALDARLNPDLFRARAPGAKLPLSALTERLSREMPHAQLGYIVYRPEAGGTVRAYLKPRLDPLTHAPYTLPENEVFIDPADGAILGMRASEGCCFGRRALIPFLYRFHYTLGLGKTGEWIMGLAAMVWTLDCMVGLLLTFPMHGTAFWHRWRRAWRVSTWRPGFRLSFDLHRAVSLWLWIVLLGVAVSGVALALDTQVFRPVIAFLLPVTPRLTLPSQDGAQTPGDPLDLDRAEELATAAAAREGWLGDPGALFVLPETHKDIFYFTSSDPNRRTGLGSPVITLDSRTGEVLTIDMPGRGKPGDLVLQLQFPWHSGQIAGLPGRIVIAITGVAVSLLSVTGVLIWERKRRARRTSGVRRRAREPKAVLI